MPGQYDFAWARQQMVDVQIARRGIKSERVLEAMRAVPRENFVDEVFKKSAYEDSPLPIGEGQTISQPLIVALMIEAAEVGPGSRVLEVGAGSGYAAAVISRIAEKVYAIERHASLVEKARRRFQTLGYENIELTAGDGTLGWPERQPFDVIMVAAASPGVPEALKQQLAIGGRMVIPVGSQERGQTLLKLTRNNKTTFEEKDLGGVMFVPLIGEQAWPTTEGAPRTGEQ